MYLAGFTPVILESDSERALIRFGLGTLLEVSSLGSSVSAGQSLLSDIFSISCEVVTDELSGASLVAV